MIVEQTTDYGLITSVLTNPEIYLTVADGSAPERSEYRVPESESLIYLIGYKDQNNIVGVMIYEWLTRYVVDCHVQVLPDQRKKHAVEFGGMVIDWLWENTDAKKAVAQIPFIYPNVRRFAEINGFAVEGVNAASYWTGEKMINQWYMGLVRPR